MFLVSLDRRHSCGSEKGILHFLGGLQLSRESCKVCTPTRKKCRLPSKKLSSRFSNFEISKDIGVRSRFVVFVTASFLESVENSNFGEFFCGVGWNLFLIEIFRFNPD